MDTLIPRTSSPEILVGANATDNRIRSAQHHSRRKRSTTYKEGLFHYKPLDRTSGSVRLLKVFPLHENDLIRCRIERHHISSTQYVALSYVWGSQDAYCKILLNGQIFKVRPNLHAFLKHLAKTGYFTETLFWIDAICIDQSNTTEKNHHISHMGTIYSHATKVISWLGNSFYYTLSGGEPPSQWVCCKDYSRRREADKRHRCAWRVSYSSSWNLLRHEYWNRLWVAQELSLARQVDILWRGRFYSWSQIKSCLSKNASALRAHGQSSTLNEAFIDNTNYIGGLPIARYLKSTHSAPLGGLVPQFARHECQIGHDHVFALLSMATDGGKFQPDYGEECISLLFRLMTFCYTSPTVALTSKLGMALGLNPEHIGLSIEFVGVPLLSEATLSNEIHYRLADNFSDQIQGTDMLIKIPDTNLHILFKASSREDSVQLYIPLARIDVVVARIEHGRKKFANKDEQQSSQESNATSAESYQAWENCFLRRDLNTSKLRLHCKWQTILFFFDSSKTFSAPGTRESRFRKWIVSDELPIDQRQTFVVRK